VILNIQIHRSFAILNDISTSTVSETIEDLSSISDKNQDDDQAGHCDDELAEHLKTLLDPPKKSAKRKGGQNYIQFIAAGKLKKVLSEVPFSLKALRFDINNIMMSWAHDIFGPVDILLLNQPIVETTQQGVLPGAASAALSPDATGLTPRGNASTGPNGTGTKRKTKHQGQEIFKEPNQVAPPPLVIKQDGTRKKMRFSQAEKEAIRQGVMKYGIGKWAQIRSGHAVTLLNRTSVNIKDCYRTMCKRGEFGLKPTPATPVSEPEVLLAPPTSPAPATSPTPSTPPTSPAPTAMV
jgi:hypothetical protein